MSIARHSQSSCYRFAFFARALTNHPRNVPDELLRRIAKNGGVVQVNFYAAFVDADPVKAG